MDFYGIQMSENTSRYVNEVLKSQYFASDGFFSRQVTNWLEGYFERPVLTTTSCTHALELALHLLELEPGDEVIIPTYTYPSTANAVLLAGGIVRYVDVESRHLNLDPNQLERVISSKTKAIIVVHYGGVCCNMKEIMRIAKKHQLWVIEDAAQGFLSTYQGEKAGTIGHMGTLSFHGTKDIVAGEGGALIISEAAFVEKAKIFRNKGTNQEAFTKGEVPYYEWVEKGSSYGPSELVMALLYGQLQESGRIVERKRQLFSKYVLFFEQLALAQGMTYSQHPLEGESNAHLFYLIFPNEAAAERFIIAMKVMNIPAYYHFFPLHESQFGQRFVKQGQPFPIAQGLGRRLVRLPLYSSMKDESIETILVALRKYFEVSDVIHCHSNL